MTRKTDILKEHNRLQDLIWYERSCRDMHPAGEKGRKRIEAEYSKEELDTVLNDPFELGVALGKMAALRWVLNRTWEGSMDT